MSIERIKLLATACNTLATALITLGVIAPALYYTTALETLLPARSAFLAWAGAICVIMAMILHLVGQAVLGALEKHDDE